MKKSAVVLAVCAVLVGLGGGASGATQPANPSGATRGLSAAAVKVNALAERYYETMARLDPLTATFAGDNRFDDQLSMTIVPAVRARQMALYREVQAALKKIPRARLGASDQTTYDCLEYEAATALRLEKFPDHLLPINHMDSVPITLANLASGQGSQPIQTVAQYDIYLQRLAQLPAWIDVAIANMRSGMARGVVQPKALVLAGLPLLKALDVASAEQSEYYRPINNLPEGFSAADKARLSAAYRASIEGSILPAVHKLVQFMQTDYLAASRDSAGWGALPDGDAWYRAWVAAQTTTSLTPDQIHEIGLKEVERIRAEFVKVGARLGYSGAPAGVGKWLATQPQTKPFKSDEEILAAYRALNATIATRLPELFGTLPKAALEVRPEPELSRATASDHYTGAAADGSRPGIFWAVIPDPRAYEVTNMTSLFLHEGQPGHHFQIARQQELAIPKFRKYGGNNAYIEGWALYAETLGREIGLYDDPVAYAGHLTLEMTRAARLVVDTGLHAKGWTREQTIAYLEQTVGNSEPVARNATERYMAWPGQALGYKIGALKIMALRQRASAALGPKFKLAAFHDAVLAEGSLPLDVLEKKTDTWIAAQGSR